MSDAQQKMERLIKAIQPFVDGHTEIKEGSRCFSLYVTPRALKELRSAFEPFREHRKDRPA